jgi:hypothetical protein
MIDAKVHTEERAYSPLLEFEYRAIGRGVMATVLVSGRIEGC